LETTSDMPIRTRPRTQDIVVAGGGIAGLALALAVRRACPGATVTLCDPRPAHPARSPRAVAVAAGARRFLGDLDAWQAVAAEAQPITAMTITDSRPEDAPRPVYLDFAGEAEPGEPFAHMVFHDDLRTALAERCTAQGVTIVRDRVTGFRLGGGALLAEAATGVLRARLLVAADGGRSRLREAAGIGTLARDYGQAGIVATLSHDISHEGRATQHFLPEGPLAILPLRAADGSPRRVSLVWTTSLAEARRLVALSPEAFVAALQGRIGRDYGALALEDVPSAHALRLVLPRRLVAERVALLGDAARTIHPLAGQGLNLGLRDAAVLAELAAERLSLGLDPGDAETLDAYQRARRFDALAMAVMTDGLNRLFSNDTLPVRLLRDVGLGLVDRLPRLKRSFMRDAAGLAGRVPRSFTR
jgi:2-octaprenyl-6-methoxyphenol hydroxylase